MESHDVQLKHDVQLNDGFEYQFNNEMVTAKFITIVGFSMRHMDKAAPVKEIAMQAIKSFTDGVDNEVLSEVTEAQKQKSDEDKAKKSEIADGKEMMSLIYMHCKEGDAAKLLVYMKKLLTSGVCSIDDETAFNGNHVDSLSFGDFEKLCGEYIGNFITS